MSRWVDIISYHSSLLADKVRTESYRRAIFETVRAGDVVLDLGTGTGILAFFACQAGAQRVYAIEMGDVVEAAKDVCLRNGLQDRVIFLNEPSYRVDLPEKVDVILTETVGNFGLEECGLLGLVVDAKQRFLKETGVVIPRSVELFIVSVELPNFPQQSFEVWATEQYGLNFSPLRALAVNNFYYLELDSGTFLSEPVSLGNIQLSQIKIPDVRSEVSLVAKRRGVLHGIGGWFAAELTENVLLSNVPPIKTPNWSHIFFPLERPVSLEKGDQLTVTIRSSDNGGLWRWQGQVDSKPDSGGLLPERKARFDHSTFLGLPLSKEKLRREAPSYAPNLSRRGEAELLLLSLFNGEKTISELERELLHRYPDCFRSLQEASLFVRKAVSRYT